MGWQDLEDINLPGDCLPVAAPSGCHLLGDEDSGDLYLGGDLVDH